MEAFEGRRRLPRGLSISTPCIHRAGVVISFSFIAWAATVQGDFISGVSEMKRRGVPESRNVHPKERDPHRRTDDRNRCHERGRQEHDHQYLADNFGPNSESRDLAPDPIVRDEDALSRTIFVQYDLPSPDEARTQGLGRAQRTTHDTFPSLITPGVVWVAGLGTNSILRVNTRNLDPAERNNEYFVKDPRNIMLGIHGIIEIPGRVHWTELMGDHLGELDTNTGEIRRYAQPTKGGGHTPRADSKGNVWFTEVSGNGKIGRWDAQTKQITEYDPVKGANYYGVVVDKKDRVFVAGMTNKTLVMWDPKTQAWSNLNPPSNVRRLALDSKDNVWACAYGNNSYSC